MSNRSQDLKREVELSASLDEKPKQNNRRQDDWRSDWDDELSKYFCGDYHGDAGLRSGFGAQLEKQRDGVSFCVTGFRETPPPRGIELGPWARGLDVGRVVDALRRIPEMAIETVRRTIAEKFDREPSPHELYDAWTGARGLVAVLSAFYSKFPVGAYNGLVGLEPYGMVAPLSQPIVKATVAWLHEQRDADLAGAEAAKRSAAAGSGIRTEALRGQHAQTVAKLAECTPAERKSLALTKRELEWLIEESLPVRIDTEGILRAKWNRPPTYDELRSTLRRANEDGKRLKTPELRDPAKKLVAAAVAEAKRDVATARAAYAAARRSNMGSRPSNKPPTREVIVASFKARSGL